jgi:MFS family permease
MRPSGSFSALYYRDFRLFWTGQWISLSGTWMHMTAQGWLVYELTGSPLYLGVVSAASTLPILLFSLIGGAVADRVDKRRIIIITQVLSMLPAFAIGALVLYDRIQIWHLLALVFMLGTINAFDIPARQSFLVNLTSRESLMNAVALNSAAFNGSRMVGPVLAGFIISGMGMAACFFINGLSYLAAIAALSRVKARGEPEHGDRRMLGDIAEGMRFLWGEPGLFRQVLMVSTFSLFGLPFVSQLPVFAGEILMTGAKGLGLLMGAAGLGAFTMALFLAFKGDVKQKARVINTASLMFPLGLLAFSYSRSFGFSLALMFFAGLTVVAFLATANSSIQLRTPDGLRGRVMSVYTLLFLGMTPIGHSMLGVMADSLGTAPAVRVTSTLGLGLSLVLMPRRKQ